MTYSIFHFEAFHKSSLSLLKLADDKKPTLLETYFVIHNMIIDGTS